MPVENLAQYPFDLRLAAERLPQLRARRCARKQAAGRMQHRRGLGMCGGAVPGLALPLTILAIDPLRGGEQVALHQITRRHRRDRKGVLEARRRPGVTRLRARLECQGPRPQA